MRGSKILFLLWPETSAYNATFRLARALAACGYQVAYAVPERWVQAVSRQGFRAVQVDLSISWPPPNQGWLRRLGHSRRAAMDRLEGLRRSLAWIKAEGFDLVLVYSTLWQHALALKELGIPFISINPSLAATWSPDVPPIFSYIQPDAAHPLLNRLRCCLAWLGLRYLGAYHHRYRGIIPERLVGLPAHLRDARVASRHLLRSVFENLYMPEYYHLLRMASRAGVRVGWGDYGHRLMENEFVMGASVLDFPAQAARPGRLYVGASIDTQRVDDEFNWSRVGTNLPVVYCSVGSHGGYWNQVNRIRLIEAVVQAFRQRPRYQLLLQLTGPDDSDRMEPLPENILAAPWFPQLAALARSSLMITHGGFGAVRESLFYGVPMVIYPCGVDQPGDAARVVRLGAGLAGDIQTVTPEGLGALVDRVMGDPSFQAAARRLQAALRADNDCAAALAHIETTLAGR
jgi:UDP:flavonoid glycosyltransferase YjiC (YdhE family)